VDPAQLPCWSAICGRRGVLQSEVSTNPLR
jgi:hypothetical protein